MIALFFKLNEKDETIVSYVPVMGMKELKNATIGLVPGMPNTPDACYLFPINCDTILDTWGVFSYYLELEDIAYDINSLAEGKVHSINFYHAHYREVL